MEGIKEYTYGEHYLRLFSSYYYESYDEEFYCDMYWHTHGEIVRDIILKANLPKVVKMAEKYHERFPDVNIHDIINSGAIGLCEAFEKYDPSFGLSFWSYAYLRVRKEMKTCIYEYSSLISFPDNKRDYMLPRIERFVNKYTLKYGEPPSIDVIARVLDFDYEDVQNLQPHWFCSIIGDDYAIDDRQIEYLLPISTDVPDRIPIMESISTEIERALATLTPRESKILHQFFGIGCPEKTINGIADKLHLVRGRVQQILRNAIRKLETGNRSRILQTYLGGENNLLKLTLTEQEEYEAYRAYVASAEKQCDDIKLLVKKYKKHKIHADSSGNKTDIPESEKSKKYVKKTGNSEIVREITPVQNRYGARWTPNEIYTVEQLFKQGLTFAVIAEKMKRSETSILDRLSKLGYVVYDKEYGEYKILDPYRKLFEIEIEEHL